MGLLRFHNHTNHTRAWIVRTAPEHRSIIIYAHRSIEYMPQYRYVHSGRFSAAATVAAAVVIPPTECCRFHDPRAQNTDGVRLCIGKTADANFHRYRGVYVLKPGPVSTEHTLAN